MSKQGHTYTVYGQIVPVSPGDRRATLNASESHWDPFDPNEDRWPGDTFQQYTWTGEHWVHLGATDNAIDDSGGV